MRVFVLGCGPAGLMAAHAAVLAGSDVSILSEKKKSDIGGAQYLHLPIPEVSDEDDPEGLIKIEKWGTERGYALKVYGNPNARTSWGNYNDGEMRGAWDLRRTYNILWDKYHDLILDLRVTPTMIPGIISEADLVVSSIPAKVICKKRHLFAKQGVYIWHRKGLDIDNLIIWNGDPSYEWYRWSKVFGVRGGHEFPITADVDMDEARLIGKPLQTNCDCWPEILKVGRYGRWHKDALTHEAFSDTVKELVERRALL